MKEKEKLEKDLKRLKTRFEKAKQQDKDKNTSRVKNSEWFPEQFKALEDELAESQPDLGKVASVLNAIEDALKRLRVA
jgi:DNA repair exonuclease SbcCD ATPase subunit